MNIGGLAQQIVKDQLYHVRWGRTPLSIGDRVSIRLVNVTKADAPIRRYRSDREVQENPFTEEEIRKMQRDTYKELKKLFEPKKKGRLTCRSGGRAKRRRAT